jgi:hypothetical protein
VVNNTIQLDAGTLKVNTAGSAFVREASSVILDTSIVSGTLELTTANNGSITVGADSSAGTMKLTANGSGSISRSGDCTLTGTMVNLTSDIGQIGSNIAPIQTAAGTLLLNTAGNAYVNEANNVTLGASAVSGTLKLTTASNGSITIGGNSSAGPLKLIAHGNGVIDRSGNFTLSGGVVNLESGSGDIGSNAVPIQVETGTLILTTAGSSYVNANENVVLGASAVTGILELATVNGSITVGADSTAGTLNLTANGIDCSGNFTLTGTIVNLVAISSDIGSEVAPIQTDAGTLTLSTTGNSYVNEADDVILGASTVSVSLNLTTANNGSITVGANSSAGTMNLMANGNGLIDRFGNFTLTGTFVNLASGSGDIGSNVTPIKTTAGTLTLNTSGGSYVNETNSVILDSSTVVGTLELTTSNNGSIFIGANSSAGTMTLAANGSGSIDRSGNFTLTGATVNLASGSGHIGSNETHIWTSAGTLTMNTTGSSYVDESDSVTLGASTIGGTLKLVTAGSGVITVGANLSAATVDLSGAGGIDRSDNWTITANTVNFASDSGDIGSIGSRLQMDTASLSVTSDSSVFLANTGTRALSITGIDVGPTFSISSTSAIANVGNVLADNISESTVANNAGISSTAQLGKAGSLTVLSANGSGNVTVSGQTLGADLDLSSGTGSISATNLQVSTVSANTSGTGVVTLAILGSGTVDDSTSGGNLTVTATQGLTVNSLEASNGSIFATAQNGPLAIGAGETIFSSGGNVLLQSANAETGTIFFGTGSQVYAAPGSRKVGKINIVVGPNGAPIAINPKAPPNITTTITRGGSINFGRKDSILANAPTNSISAIGKSVVFNVTSRRHAVNPITLNGDVHIGAGETPIAFSPLADDDIGDHDDNGAIVDTGDVSEDTLEFEQAMAE